MKDTVKEKLNGINTDKMVDALGGIVSSTLALAKEVGKVAVVGLEVAEVVVEDLVNEAKEAMKEKPEEKDENKEE